MAESLERINKGGYQGISEFINPEITYVLKLKGGQILANKKGKDWIKDFFGTKAKKRKFSWLDILNSGKLLNGREYHILALYEGETEPKLAYAGVASSSDIVETLQDSNLQTTNTVVPFQHAYNPITERGNMRMLADTMQSQANQTIQTLQDELSRKDEFMRDLQNDATKVYERITENERQFYAEKEIWLKEKSELLKEIEALNRKFDIETLKYQMQKESMEREAKLERKLEKLQMETSRKTDWGAVLSDRILPVVEKFAGGGLSQMLMNNSGGTIAPMMADLPKYDIEGDDES